MNKFLLFGLITIGFFVASNQDMNYRPYISTRLAKVILQEETKPDEDNQELCDGSGWITHGDGHKTECPGCSACKNNEPNVEPSEEVCQCGCGKKGCKCQESGECTPTEQAVAEDPVYYIYHFGAEWCAPCQQMKKETWEDKAVKDLIKNRKGKLFIYDADKEEDKEFFKFYGVKRYPTVIIVEVDNLESPVYRISGKVSKENMINILKGQLKDGE